MMSSGAGVAGLAQAHNPSEMKRQKAVFMLGGHGAKDEGSEMGSRSKTERDPLLALRGNTNVRIYTPVGDSREGVSSGQILEKGVYTNTSLAPSIAVVLVCDEKKKYPPRELLNEMAMQLQLHDKLANIVYTNPGNQFQINPIEDKNVWQMYMGEQFRPGQKGAIKEMLARTAAGDELHFPFGLTFLLLYDDETGILPNNLLDSAISQLMLNNNCKLAEAEFTEKLKLLEQLKQNNSIVDKVIEPFAQSPRGTPNSRWADLNLVSSRNSGEINHAIREIASEARKRIASGVKSEHDEWLLENEGLVLDCLIEVQTTKQSKLSKLVFICKYILPPDTDIEIVDQTCSSDYTPQPKWVAVTTRVGGNVESYEGQQQDSASDTDADAAAADAAADAAAADADVRAESSWRNTLIQTFWKGWSGFTSLVSAAAGVGPAVPHAGHGNGRGRSPSPKRRASGGSRKSRKQTTLKIKKIMRKTKKRAYKSKSQKRNSRK